MRAPADIAKIQAFMAALGRTVKSSGRVYLTGGGHRIALRLAQQYH